jgi:alpha-galactosidase
MNEEVISVDQNSEHPQCIYQDSTKAIWISHVLDSKQINIGIFNLANQPQNISFSFKQIGNFKKAATRDLWKRKEVGVFKNKFQQTIDAHDALLLRITPE